MLTYFTARKAEKVFNECTALTLADWHVRPARLGWMSVVFLDRKAMNQVRWPAAKTSR
jgi:hypothetical protein